MHLTKIDSPALLKIAKALFSQVRAWGRLLLDRGDVSESFLRREDIGNYFKYLSYFLYFLEEEAGLNFDDDDIPTLYTTNNRDTDIGLGGSTLGSTTITCEYILRSYSSAWLLQSASESEKFKPQRFLRAAIWVARHTGIGEAMRYILNLERHGYIIDSELTEEASFLLLWAYRVSHDDAEMLGLFFDGQLPETQIEWIETPLSIDFDKNRPEIRRVPDSVLLTIIQCGLDECEDFRQSTSYNESLLVQRGLGTFLHLIRELIAYCSTNDSIFLKSISEQFEEICADMGTIKLFEDEYSFKWKFANSLIRGRDEYFISRIIEERALIPYALKPFVNSSEGLNNVPLEWTELSPPVSLLYLLLASRKNIGTIWRRRYFDPQDIDDEILYEVLAKHSVDGSIDKPTIANLGKDFLLKAIQVELVPVLENGFATLSVKTLPKEEGFKATFARWKSEYLPQIKERLDKLHDSLSIKEIIQKMEEAWNADDTETLLARLHSLNMLYPSFALCLAELAIAYDDRAGDLPKALAYIEKAVALDPADPQYWQSVEVILRKLEGKPSGNLISVYRRLLELPDSDL